MPPSSLLTLTTILVLAVSAASAVTTATYGGAPVAIVELGRVELTVPPPPTPTTVSYVALHVALLHTKAEDVRCRLVAPNAASVDLLTGLDAEPLQWDVVFDDGADAFVLEDFQSVFLPGTTRSPIKRFSTLRGLSPAGTWAVECTDSRPSDHHGLLYSATLIISDSPVACGDGDWISEVEECDDGNSVDNDGCSSSCSREPGFSCSVTLAAPTTCVATVCGDGVLDLDASEQCDDGNSAAGDGCSPACLREPSHACSPASPSPCWSTVCGDGVTSPPEQCDDGNTASGDGCSSTCLVELGYLCTNASTTCAPSCGNGVLDSGELCDNDPSSSACLADCSFALTCSPIRTYTAAASSVRSHSGSSLRYSIPSSCESYVEPDPPAATVVTSFRWIALDSPHTVTVYNLNDATNIVSAFGSITTISALSPLVINSPRIAFDFEALSAVSTLVDNSLRGFELDYYSLPASESPSVPLHLAFGPLPSSGSTRPSTNARLLTTANLACVAGCVFTVDYQSDIALHLSALSWVPASGATLTVASGSTTLVSLVAPAAPAPGADPASPISITATSSPSAWAAFLSAGFAGASSGAPLPLPITVPGAGTLVITFTNPAGASAPASVSLVYNADSSCVAGLPALLNTTAHAHASLGFDPRSLSFHPFIAAYSRCVWRAVVPLTTHVGYATRITFSHVHMEDPADSLAIVAPSIRTAAASPGRYTRVFSATSVVALPAPAPPAAVDVDVIDTTGEWELALSTSGSWPAAGWALSTSWACGTGTPVSLSAPSGYLSVDTAHAAFAGVPYSAAACTWTFSASTPLLIHINVLAMVRQGDTVSFSNATGALATITGNQFALSNLAAADLNAFYTAHGVPPPSDTSASFLFVPAGALTVAFVPASSGAAPQAPRVTSPVPAFASETRSGFLASYTAGVCTPVDGQVGATGLLTDGSPAALLARVFSATARDAAVAASGATGVTGGRAGVNGSLACTWIIAPPTVPRIRHIKFRFSKLYLDAGAVLTLRLGTDVAVSLTATNTLALAPLAFAAPVGDSVIADLFGPAATQASGSTLQPRLAFRLSSNDSSNALELVVFASSATLELAVSSPSEPSGAAPATHYVASYEVFYSCPPGAVDAFALESSCLFCDPGTYTATDAREECVPCPTGTFALGYGTHGACWTCPPAITSLVSADAANALPPFLSVHNVSIATTVLLPLCMPSSFPAPAPSSSTGVSTALVAGLAGAGVTVCCVCVVLAVLYLMRARVGSSKVDPESMLTGHVGYEIQYEDITFDKAIGTGSYGEVWRGLWRGTDVAIKRIHNRDFSPETLEEFRREAKMMCDLRHPNVVLFMGACTQLPNLVMVTEYLERGNVFSLLHDPEVELANALRVRMLVGAASGIQFLHAASPPILHNDLKSLNLLVTTSWDVKVADFGLTCIKDDVVDEAEVGTAFWTAPEVLNGLGASTASDVYSFGIVMWEMLTRDTLYDGLNANAVMLLVATGKVRPEVREKGNESPLWHAWRSVMESAWAQDPTDRPPITDIVIQLKKLQALVSEPRKSQMTDSTVVSQRSDSDGHILGVPGASAGAEAEPGTSQVAPTGRVAFVFADVKNTTALWNDVPVVMRDVITALEELIADMATKHGAYMLEMQEGAFVAVLSSATGAVTFALDVMTAVHDHAEWPPEIDVLNVLDASGDNVVLRGPHLALGIHAGLPACDVNPNTNKMSYSGPSVQKATLVGAMAQGGQVLVTEATLRETRADTMAPEFATRAIGLCLLPGFDEPETVTAIAAPRLATRLEVLTSGALTASSTHDAYVWQNYNGRATDIHGNSADGKSTWEQVKDRYVLSSMYRIRYEEVELLERCGMGTYGELYRCQYRGEEVAMKRLLRKKLPEALLLDFKCEVIITAQLNHPNIVQFLGACTFPYLCLVTEFCTLGSVHSQLTNPAVRFDWPRRAAIARDIADGMHYLHSLDMPIMHRDLKTPNVLLDSSWTAKLCDFGLARIKSSHSTMTKCGTIAWTAPEVLTGKRYSLKADVFSFGLVLWELVTAKFPYIDLKGTPTVKIVKMILAGHRPNFSREWPKLYVDLMTACWSGAESERPSFSDILVKLEAIRLAVDPNAVATPTRTMSPLLPPSTPVSPTPTPTPTPAAASAAAPATAPAPAADPAPAPAPADPAPTSAVLDLSSSSPAPDLSASASTPTTFGIPNVTTLGRGRKYRNPRQPRQAPSPRIPSIGGRDFPSPNSSAPEHVKLDASIPDARDGGAAAAAATAAAATATAAAAAPMDGGNVGSSGGEGASSGGGNGASSGGNGASSGGGAAAESPADNNGDSSSSSSSRRHGKHRRSRRHGSSRRHRSHGHRSRHKGKSRRRGKHRGKHRGKGKSRRHHRSKRGDDTTGEDDTGCEPDNSGDGGDNNSSDNGDGDGTHNPDSSSASSTSTVDQ